MADNTQLPSGSGGDTIRDKDRAGIKTQVVGLDLGIGTGSESLMTGKMPSTIADGDAATIGALADAKVTGDNTGSLAAKLRGLLYEIGDQADAASLTTSMLARLRQIGVLLNGGLPAALGAGGGLKVDGSGTLLPVDSELTTADVDTGAGTDTRAVVGIVGAASGGGVLIGATAGGAQKGDITTIAGTAPTTVGKLDVKSADGDLASIGANADAKVTGDNSGSLAAKLRGLLYEVGDQADAASLTTSLLARLRQIGVLLNGGLPAALAAGGGLKTDMTTIVGTAPSTSSGNKDAGTLRVTLATDQVALTNALKTDGSAVTQPVQGKPTYGAGTAVTITLASLGATSGREGAAVDNTTNLYEDALVMAVLKSNAVSANDTVAYIYVAGDINDGADNWPDAVTGSDAAITVNSPTQLKLLGVINFGAAGAAAGTFKGGPWSVAALFGGSLPKKWSIVVVNSNAALTATAGDHKVIYQGVNR